jgi:hypothetical protein
MKYQVTQPFIAFGLAPHRGEVIDLTEEQAALLAGNDCVTPYEMKVMPPPENKRKKKPTPSASSQAARAPVKTTRKRSAKKPTK